MERGRAWGRDGVRGANKIPVAGTLLSAVSVSQALASIAAHGC
jgi:hypothetical protein